MWGRRERGKCNDITVSPVKCIYTKPTDCLHRYHLHNLCIYSYLGTENFSIWGSYLVCGFFIRLYFWFSKGVRKRTLEESRASCLVFGIGYLCICFRAPLALIGSVFCGGCTSLESNRELTLQGVRRGCWVICSTARQETN